MPSLPARPRKVAPPHPGGLAADILEDCGTSLRTAAKAIGLSPNGMSKVLTGKGPITPETALKFGAYFGNGPGLWLQMQNEYDLWHARERLGGALKAIKKIKAPKREDDAA